MERNVTWVVTPERDRAKKGRLDSLIAVDLHTVRVELISPLSRRLRDLASEMSSASPRWSTVVFLNDIREFVHARGEEGLIPNFEGEAAAEELRRAASVTRTILARSEGVHAVRLGGIEAPVSRTGKLLCWDLDFRLIVDLIEDVRSAVIEELSAHPNR